MIQIDPQVAKNIVKDEIEVAVVVATFVRSLHEMTHIRTFDSVSIENQYPMLDHFH